MTHKLFNEIDRNISFIGIIFSLFFILWYILIRGRLIWITVGLLFLFSCITYLIIRKYLKVFSLLDFNLLKTSRKNHFLLNVLIFFFFLYSIFSILLRVDLYVRPIEYFITMAILTSLIAVKILFLPNSKSSIYIVLLLIILIGISFELSPFAIYPNYLGVDPYWHEMFTLKILNATQIPEGYAYSQLPTMHLIILSVSITTGLSYKFATIISVSLVQIFLNATFIFLIGNFLFNCKVGLLGSLFLVMSNYHIRMGYWGIPNTLAAVYIPIVIYLLLKLKRKMPRISISLGIFFMAILILTHTITSAWMAIILFIFWAGYIFRSLTGARAPTGIWDHKYYNSIIKINIPVMFLIGMFSWWIYASGHISMLGHLINSSFISYSPYIPKEIIDYQTFVPFFEQLINNIGIFLFFSISFIGCFYMISNKFGNSYSFIIANCGMVTFILTFSSILFGLRFFSNRWIYFSQIILSLPLSLALFILCSTIKNKLGKTIFLFFLTFLLTFFMILSPVVNFDNPMFSPTTKIRLTFIESEIKAMETVQKVGNKTIGVDSYYALLLQYTPYPFKSIDEQIYNKTFIDLNNSIVLIREEIVHHPFLQFNFISCIDYDPRDTLVAEYFSKIYDCGSVSGFFKGK